MDPNTNPQTAVAVAQSTQAVQKTKMYSMVPTTFDQFVEFANTIAHSNLCPSRYKGKVEDVMVAMQLGNELGLQPLQSLQSIAVINGMPAVYGQGLMGIILASPVCEYIRVAFDEAAQSGICRAKRRGYAEEEVHTFSLEDAKKAKLFGKVGPWQEYPKVMCMWRALGIMSKMYFADVTKGIVVAEEAMDYPVDISRNETDDINARIRQTREQRGGQAASARKVTTDGAVDAADVTVVDVVDTATGEVSRAATVTAKPKATPENLIDLFNKHGVDSSTFADQFAKMVTGVDSVMELDEAGVKTVGARLVAVAKEADVSHFISVCSNEKWPIGTHDEVVSTIELFKAASE